MLVMSRICSATAMNGRRPDGCRRTVSLRGSSNAVHTRDRHRKKRRRRRVAVAGGGLLQQWTSSGRTPRRVEGSRLSLRCRWRVWGRRWVVREGRWVRGAAAAICIRAIRRWRRRRLRLLPVWSANVRRWIVVRVVGLLVVNEGERRDGRRRRVRGGSVHRRATQPAKAPTSEGGVDVLLLAGCFFQSTSGMMAVRDWSTVSPSPSTREKQLLYSTTMVLLFVGYHYRK